MAPRTWIAWTTSFALHAALTGGGVLLLRADGLDAKAAATLASPASTIAIELPTMSETAETASAPTAGDPQNVTPDVRDPIGQLPPTLGGEAIARTDTGHAGHGGQMHVAAPAINLDAHDDRVHLSPDPMDRLDRDQVQRLKTANERTAWEDRRATTHPTELSFLASGQGERPERRAPAPSDPSRGLARADEASRPGGLLGGDATRAVAGDEAYRQLHAAMARGVVTSAAGLGVTNGQLGVDHRASADVTHARPDVTMGPTTIPARTAARPNDTVDSDQEVATALQSLVHASTAGGVVGDGAGGSDGANESAPGAGGARGEGSRARSLGDGAPDWFDIDTSDPRLLPYFRRLHARIDPLVEHAFPTSAVLDLKQGTVILDFVIHADGSTTVEWPPRRPSGIPEFDKNCAEAIRKAAPFDPPPAAILGANARELRVRAPFAETRRW